MGYNLNFPVPLLHIGHQPENLIFQLPGKWNSNLYNAFWVNVKVSSPPTTLYWLSGNGLIDDMTSVPLYLEHHLDN